MAPPAEVTIRYEQNPDEKTIEDAARLYIDLSKDDPAFDAAVSGRRELSWIMATGVLKPLSLVSGELYTAKNEKGELVGFSGWTPPGRDVFDTPDQLEMGFSEFLSQLDEEARKFQRKMLGENIPKFVDGSLGIEKAEIKTYWCWFAYVREDYQNMGIATAIFDIVYEKAKSTGALMGLLTGGAVNVAKYEHLGFKNHGEQHFVSWWAEWTFYCLARKTSE
ncbi:hypothetical protein BN946_scf184508.g1 [Trametes cinnabarina]|uniref:N-acetyltransferase domain-containing protein n=1 Tax=Pycnoporus cinnabarinus TaxID=5643 RepID=A0A060SUR4_PYCCI|nr:hypothetical protein BN946_scf184508.g1 [Trametes cinnabarina]